MAEKFVYGTTERKIVQIYQLRRIFFPSSNDSDFKDFTTLCLLKIIKTESV